MKTLLFIILTKVRRKFVGLRDGTGQDRIGPRDLEGPVVLAGQDLETLKVPGLFLNGPGTSRPLFSPRIAF